MADHPLRSATDRRLGRPLPHQPANQTQVHPIPINLWPSLHAKKTYYEVLITVSSGYPSVWGRLPTRYSPVRRFPFRSSAEASDRNFSLDLHVLGTPPAFILSQDQTLNWMVYQILSDLLSWFWFRNSDVPVWNYLRIVLVSLFRNLSLQLFSLRFRFLKKWFCTFTESLHYVVFNVRFPAHRTGFRKKNRFRFLPNRLSPCGSSRARCEALFSFSSANFYIIASFSISVNSFFNFFNFSFWRLWTQCRITTNSVVELYYIFVKYRCQGRKFTFLIIFCRKWPAADKQRR